MDITIQIEEANDTHFGIYAMSDKKKIGVAIPKGSDEQFAEQFGMACEAIMRRALKLPNKLGATLLDKNN